MRRFRLLLATTLITAASAAAPAAELEVLEFGGGYRLRVTGTITPDTTKQLVDMIRGRGEFPDALLLSADEGDPVAGIELGRFARAAMLRVSAGKACGNACVLAWAGGVNRATRSPLRITDAVAGDATVSDYLAEMGAALPDVGTAPGVPPTHDAWLAERCGSLTVQQKSDLQAVRALQALESSLEAMTMGGMGSQSSYTVDARTQRDAARARKLSADERDAVMAAQTKIDGCRDDAIAQARARLMAGVGPAQVPDAK